MNPLLKNSHLPLFSQILPEHVEPAIDHMLAHNRATVQQLLRQNAFTWENLMQPLDDMSDKFHHLWLVVSHIHAVMDSDEMRAAYTKSLAKVTDYSIEMSHNKELYSAVKFIAESPELKQLSPVQQLIINDELRDFHLSGVDLPPQEKQRFSEIQQRLSKLMNDFEENVLDATQGWNCHIQDEAKLKGLPEHAIAAAAEVAKQKNLPGWVFTLEIPSYIAVLTYAESRELREQMYEQYVTRASDQGINASRWDNSRVMQEILQLRQETSRLLGFSNYAELSLATKTAKNTDEVLKFLHELADYSLPISKKEFTELSRFAKKYGIDDVKPWDISFLNEKYKQSEFAISEEELRGYFPADQVLQGMFEVVKRLFGVEITESFDVETWHPDVRFFTIYDNGKIRGQFYLDLYARENKRGGAWAEECRSHRRLLDGSIQTPVAFLNCNFAHSVGDTPSLLLHEDVITLFHEFGHGLHQMLSTVDYASVSGTNNVPWDVVEFPSQFMENWCWEKSAFALLTKHFQTGEQLPDDLYKKLHATKTYQAATRMLRQLEFALFDFRLHMEFDNEIRDQIQHTIDQVRAKLTPFTVPDYNRFQHSFSHIFGSGYAAGYYSYKWAEVWSSDAFSLFEEKGIFDQATGKSFLKNILEKGGSEDPMVLFKAFRGRAPEIHALLRHIEPQ